MKREFLMLAFPYVPEKHGINGWFMSEKLDGMRCFWDGGITRGLQTKEVPFANTEKDYIKINQDIRATGLWSRGGKAIMAPDWWLDKLPPFPLDGELYAGRGNFQLTTSIVKDMIPNDDDWKLIKFCVFDSPSIGAVLFDGEIDFKAAKKQLHGVVNWAKARAKEHPPIANVFEITYNRLKGLGIMNNVVSIHEQTQLHYNTARTAEILESKLDQVTLAGGEGLILRAPNSFWVPERSHNLLKVKKWLDSEAIVKGYVWGKGKLLGKMGAMILDWRGKIFELSGFTDAERELNMPSGNSANAIGRLSPGQRVELPITSMQFPIDSRITFKYRELTDAGIPKEGRYWRKS